MLKIKNRQLIKYIPEPGEAAVVIPEGVEEIGEAAFDECDRLVRVTLPESLEIIGEAAFRDCSRLSEITFPPHLQVIGDRAFQRCSSLRSVRLPDSVQRIGRAAFAVCKALGEVSFPLCDIGCEAFVMTAWFDSLRRQPQPVILGDMLLCGMDLEGDVTVPEGVRVIAGSAFMYSKVTSVTLPEGLRLIGDHAFDKCVKLTRVHIPDSVTHIGEFAFLSCERLTSLTLPYNMLLAKSAPFVLMRRLYHLRWKGRADIRMDVQFSGLRHWASNVMQALQTGILTDRLSPSMQIIAAAGLWRETRSAEGLRVIRLYPEESMEQLLRFGDTDDVEALTHEDGVLTAENIDRLLALAAQYEQPECYAMFLRWKASHGGYGEAENTLLL